MRIALCVDLVICMLAYYLNLCVIALFFAFIAGGMSANIALHDLIVFLSDSTDRAWRQLRALQLKVETLETDLGALRDR